MNSPLLRAFSFNRFIRLNVVSYDEEADLLFLRLRRFVFIITYVSTYNVQPEPSPAFSADLEVNLIVAFNTFNIRHFYGEKIPFPGIKALPLTNISGYLW
ncbi:hypothetical protein KK010_23080 [Enterobacter mori]|uniref:hypothetical protein n=1 Tax=Enterobacter mori TaxID=539813 RepID=UPI001BE084AD|nr:hypothetical protein [Enterobacter mori]MBT1872808.1 hypothetical protein [Enterobacter mori]HCM9655505.1 hypothetical protein [Enterobacter kobei]